MIVRFAQVMVRLVAAILLLAARPAFAQPRISEILLKPPVPDNQMFQYIELRGAPNELLPAGCYFVAVEGDTNGNPGTIQNTFDLSGQRLGGNGFLVLLQKSNTYSVVANAMALEQNGAQNGFGNGSGSTIGHRGEGDRTDMEGASATFFLIQTTNRPDIGDDLDADNNGLPDAAWYPSWMVYDSIGMLDNSGLGDIAYGAINFRRNPNAQAGGTVVNIGFTPDYVARTGNTTGSAAEDWLAATGLTGTAPPWSLGDSTHTVPTAFANASLNHLGGPNFGAPTMPGVSILPNLGGLVLPEGGASNAVFTIALTTVPAGPVVVRLQTGPALAFSLNNGLSYLTNGTASFGSTNALAVRVKSVEVPGSDWVEGLPHLQTVRFSLESSADPANYPLGTPLPQLPVWVTDNDRAWLNELKVNPPGADQPWEFVELAGTPAAQLTNLWLVAIAGNPGDNPGRVTQVLDLNGARLGSNGLLVVGPPTPSYPLPLNSGYFPCPAFATGSALPNEASTLLLLAARSTPEMGADWDNGDNGKLEGLPDESVILDSVAWGDQNPNSIAYSPAILRLAQGVPDAASRFAGNSSPNATNGWFFGQLFGTNAATLEYDSQAVGPGFPYGTLLSPGGSNTAALILSALPPLAGAIGDPTNPKASFTLTNLGGSQVTLWAVSDNPAVVSNANLSIAPGGPSRWNLDIRPHGVGYATIAVEASDGTNRARVSFSYAASDMGRPGGRFHAGAADGSTAIPLDDNWMLVGDDENQVLRLYPRNASGPAVWQTNMTPYLGLTDIEAGVPREVDIEASVRVGNRIYWLGAHSHANIAEGRTNRSRMFATDLSGTGTNITLAYAGRYDYLKLDMVNWDVANGHGKGANYYGLAASTEEGVNPKSPEGFNIEGLAMAPGSTTTAYVALRTPIVPPTNRCFALIVPVLNFTSLAGTNLPPGSAVFGQPIELDLFGRGFRSLQESSAGYLIVAGTPLTARGPYPDDPKLYLWVGPNDVPHELTANLDGLNPEGIVGLPPPPWTAGTQVQLLSDNGTMDWYGDGTQAKFLPTREFRKCRSDWVALGNVTRSAPILQPISYAGTNIVLRWRATAGVSYRVQFKSNLSAANWSDLANPVTAPGPWASLVDTNAAFGPRFYRVITP